MCFYGAIEQLLSGWIFDLLPKGDDEFESAKALVVETICGGLESRVRRPSLVKFPAMGNDLTKRLMWSGLLAGVGALATIVVHAARHLHLDQDLRRGPA